VHCVCSVCGHTREHELVKYGNCYRCGREESRFTVDENNEIVEDPGSRSACGFVPDGTENHGGWHGVGEVIDEFGNRRFCGCQCGHYTDKNDRYYPRGYEGDRRGAGLMSLTLDHLFVVDRDDIEWEPGDENGNDTETQHHAILYCEREPEGAATYSYVTEGHSFYRDDGTYNCYVKGCDDEDAAENYHMVVGVCLKCDGEVETADLHRREIAEAGEMGTCVCVGGVNFPDSPGCGETHHLFVWTPCGEYRCLYCLSYSDDSIRIPESSHTGTQPPGVSAGDKLIMTGYENDPEHLDEQMWGVVLRAGVPDGQGHWCGCGMVQIPHSFLEDPETHDHICQQLYPGEEWWKEPGCGWVQNMPDDEDGEYQVTTGIDEERGGYSLKQRKFRMSSFVWNPDKPESEDNPRPKPEDLWPDDPDRPGSLPPILWEDLTPTVVDFTYETPISISWEALWVYRKKSWIRQLLRDGKECFEWYRSFLPVFFSPVFFTGER
jgi:hypothetical protein